MTTAKAPTYLEVSGDGAARAIEDAGQKLASEEELTLDFSRVARIDPGALRALEALALAAEEKSAKVALRSVNVAVYKVLTLARLTSRFSFES